MGRDVDLLTVDGKREGFGKPTKSLWVLKAWIFEGRLVVLTSDLYLFNMGKEKKLATPVGECLVSVRLHLRK